MGGRATGWLLRSLVTLSVLVGTAIFVVARPGSSPSSRPHFDVETSDVVYRLFTGAEDPAPENMSFVEGTRPVLPPYIVED